MPPPIQRLPGQGKVTLPSPFPKDKKPYVFQPYPSTRFHPDGRELTVQNEAEEQERCPVADGWARSPFPPKPIAPPIKEKTAAEWKAVAEEKAKLAISLGVQLAEKEDAHAASQACLAEKMAEIQELHRELGEAHEQICVRQSDNQPEESATDTPAPPARRRR